MSRIQVRNLSFCYEGNPDPLFENINLQIDTEWRLGFISRNGRGKTTFLRILAGMLPYTGQIEASVRFDYFPYAVPDTGLSALGTIRNAIAPFDAWEAEMEACLARGDDASLARYGELLEQMIALDGYRIDELIAREAGRLRVDPLALERPFRALSHGERTKLLIAALFLRQDTFLLIDEPTNHLDAEGRIALEAYLSSKQGFILVSHDRALLDGVCDHVLSINRADIEVQRGNYSSWRENRTRQDQYEQQQNEALRGEIGRLTQAMQRNADWSGQVEASKIGTHTYDRGHVGALAAKMMKRAKTIERRTGSMIEEKKGLLKNIEVAEALKLRPLPYPKPRLLEAVGLQVDYGDGPLFEPVSFTLAQGERLAITGPNGAGKTSLLRMALGEQVLHEGLLRRGSGLEISYVSQDTSHLRGLPKAYATDHGLDTTLFFTILRKLDFQRALFDQPIESYSAGQQKKVLLAASLSAQAHLYVWDEPLNYIDVLSREQIEALLTASGATMLFVEHDRSFVSAVATGQIELARPARVAAGK